MLTGVDADGEAGVRGDACTGAVERELGDGNAHRLNAEVAQCADALAVR
jgi:hypothetical protein